jgi:hypothetical protein
MFLDFLYASMHSFLPHVPKILSLFLKVTLQNLHINNLLSISFCFLFFWHSLEQYLLTFNLFL